MQDCIFCKIVAGEIPCHKVWENEKHLAFLTIFPNSEWVTVVIPKDHYPSYIFELSDDIIANLVFAARTVAKKIDAAFEDVGRTAMVFEGFWVDHIHAKLFPLHGTNDPNWKPIHSNVHTFFTQYPGFISSHDWDRADDILLAQIADKIQNS